MGNNQKPRSSSCMVIEPHNFEILPFRPNGYLIPIFLNIAIPAITDFHPTISKFYQPSTWNFTGLELPFNTLFGDR